MLFHLRWAPFVAAALWLPLSTHAADVATPAGLLIFEKHCVACHQAGGQGLPGLAPALAGTLASVVTHEEGRRYVASVLLNGLSGRIVSQGRVLIGAMPIQAQLSDSELADVANYIAKDFNRAPDAGFLADDFARLRGSKVSHKDLRTLRARLIP